ncbi:hypothetical protein BKA61DRAFT_301709 [Leptodontidium sp. MPI-SDFR-AT-0119]|nr:hypothetical protein BKA61DRAFT_301709 [Leptodontidium sp. MPI-SDFR-AT-0119]
MLTAQPAGTRGRESIRVRRKRKKSDPQILPCTECNATFNRAAHLRRHQRMHQGDKPYICAHCSLSSSRKDVIVRHTRNFHPEAASINASDGSEMPANAPTDVFTERDRARDSCSSLSSTSSEDSPPGSTVAKPAYIGEDHPHPAWSNAETQPLSSARNDEFDNILSDANLHFPDLAVYASNNPPLQDLFLTDNLFPNFSPPQGFVNSSLWQILLSPTQDMRPNVSRSEQSGLQAPHVIRHFPEHDQHQTGSSFVLDNDGYAKAQANLAHYNPSQKLLHFRFPSKYAVIRFVDAYFEFMDPQLPIVHRPTFDAATVPSPLLIAVMACGAMYSSEQGAAAMMHAASLQLTSENWKTDNPFQLWLLQTNLLLGFFEVYCGDWTIPQRACSIFSCNAKLAQEAVGTLKLFSIATYRDWVYQETVNRCMASTIVLAAAVNSTSQKQYIVLPDLDARFSLPSSMTAWVKDESSWERPTEMPIFSDTLKRIFAGEPPILEISDFGFLSIVSAVLGHICLFENLAGSQHPHLYTSFVNEMERSVQILGEMWAMRTVSENSYKSTHTPQARSTKLLLDSVFYHLYGNSQLAAMKNLLGSAEVLNRSEMLQEISKTPHSINLEKALIRAAEALRDDCRLGLRYLQKMAPHRFAPLSATAVFEGGLLLCWYLQTKRSETAATEVHSTLDLLIGEGFAELDGLQMTTEDELTTLPLLANAEVLHDGSVWQWPHSVSSKLNCFIQRFKLVS